MFLHLNDELPLFFLPPSSLSSSPPSKASGATTLSFASIVLSVSDEQPAKAPDANVSLLDYTFNFESDLLTWNELDFISTFPSSLTTLTFVSSLQFLNESDSNVIVLGVAR